MQETSLAATRETVTYTDLTYKTATSASKLTKKEGDMCDTGNRFNKKKGIADEQR